MKRLLLGLVIVLLFGCEEKVKPSFIPVQEKEIPSQESWQSTVVFSDSAKVKAVLWAGHISAFAAQHYTLMDDSIHVDFYNETGQHTSLLTARRGKVNDLTQDLEAYENVVVISDSGTVMRTESLFWTNAERKIHTDAFVDIASPTEHIMGQGLVSDQGLKNYRITKVTGQAVPKND